MANLFDGLQDRLFDLTKKVFGYDATWSPSLGGAERATRVLFREPNEAEKQQAGNYMPTDFYCEFRTGDTFGIDLYNALRSGNDEEIEINGRMFDVLEVIAAFDGRTYKAKLQEQ
jgi:hypothetical protein